MAGDFFFKQLKTCAISKIKTDFFEYSINSQEGNNCIIVISASKYLLEKAQLESYIKKEDSMQCNVPKDTPPEKFQTILFPGTEKGNCQGSLVGAFENIINMTNGEGFPMVVHLSLYMGFARGQVGIEASTGN